MAFLMSRLTTFLCLHFVANFFQWALKAFRLISAASAMTANAMPLETELIAGTVEILQCKDNLLLNYRSLICQERLLPPCFQLS